MFQLVVLEWKVSPKLLRCQQHAHPLRIFIKITWADNFRSPPLPNGKQPENLEINALSPKSMGSFCPKCLPDCFQAFRWQSWATQHPPLSIFANLAHPLRAKWTIFQAIRVSPMPHFPYISEMNLQDCTPCNEKIGRFSPRSSFLVYLQGSQQKDAHKWPLSRGSLLWYSHTLAQDWVKR